jgi:hypothetical protein
LFSLLFKSANKCAEVRESGGGIPERRPGLNTETSHVPHGRDPHSDKVRMILNVKDPEVAALPAVVQSGGRRFRLITVQWSPSSPHVQIDTFKSEFAGAVSLSRYRDASATAMKHFATQPWSRGT